ncbi:hypothetical protein ABI59_19975 [Acidobacteria bacterium Mor1]|nr:hypothetical protein ABI59_19975 [Acidobacteria bacterium Mor1]
MSEFMRIPLFVLLLAALFAPAVQGRALTDEQWREDIDAAVAHILENHPRPFATGSRETFESLHAALLRDVPGLADRDVALRLAALVAVIEDGHTRLALPRGLPRLAHNPAHHRDDPAHPALLFGSLPFRFYRFEEGLYIVETIAGYEPYLGARVLAFGSSDVDAALAAVEPILYAENEHGARLLAADRLSLPDVLMHFGLVEDSGPVSLVLQRPGQEPETLRVPPYEDAENPEPVGPRYDEVPFARQYPDRKRWHAQVPGKKAWYVQLDEIEMFPDTPTADFFAEALDQARRHRADRLLLDLRSNTGGSGSFNAAIVNALARSEYNAYGRLFVLTGRETFSAASMLMVALEEYVNAIFVGEPSGARPTTYGDPRRLRLPHSGLTLRTSTLVWPSSFAGDFREFIETHVDAPPTAADFFAGRDPAIEAVLAYEPPRGPVAQMVELFEKDKLQSGLIRFFTWLRSPVDGSHAGAVDDLIVQGHRYLDDGQQTKGRFMMSMARDYYPANAAARVGLGRAMELGGDAESARERYREALELAPDFEPARKALARLDAGDEPEADVRR